MCQRLVANLTPSAFGFVGLYQVGVSVTLCLFHDPPRPKAQSAHPSCWSPAERKQRSSRTTYPPTWTARLTSRHHPSFYLQAWVPFADFGSGPFGPTPTESGARLLEWMSCLHLPCRESESRLGKGLISEPSIQNRSSLCSTPSSISHPTQQIWRLLWASGLRWGPAAAGEDRNR